MYYTAVAECGSSRTCGYVLSRSSHTMRRTGVISIGMAHIDGYPTRTQDHVCRNVLTARVRDEVLRESDESRRAFPAQRQYARARPQTCESVRRHVKRMAESVASGRVAQLDGTCFRPVDTDGRCARCETSPICRRPVRRGRNSSFIIYSI